MHAHIVHPPSAKWLRECCNRHLWPEVRRQMETLIDRGETSSDARYYFEREVRSFSGILRAGETGDGVLLVAPPEGMSVTDLARCVEFAIAEWKYERDGSEG